MKHDEALLLQAWMDGQLTGAEAAAAETLARTPEGAHLLAGLRHAREHARTGAGEWPLPESREFFWSKVRRDIEALDRAPAPAPAPRPGWLRWLVPAGAAALAVFFVARQPVAPAPAGLAGQRLEAPLDDMRAMVFHSQSDGVTVVWVADALNFAMY